MTILVLSYIGFPIPTNVWSTSEDEPSRRLSHDYWKVTWAYNRHSGGIIEHVGYFFRMVAYSKYDISWKMYRLMFSRVANVQQWWNMTDWPIGLWQKDRRIHTDWESGNPGCRKGLPKQLSQPGARNSSIDSRTGLDPIRCSQSVVRLPPAAFSLSRAPRKIHVTP
jgi:hypothetical protein